MFTHLPDVALLVGDESDDDEDEFDERGRVIHPSERTSAEFLLCGDVVVSSPRRRRRHGPRKIWVHATLQFTKLRISHFSVAQRAHLQTLIARRRAARTTTPSRRSRSRRSARRCSSTSTGGGPQR